jgi:hypothetical protein
MRLGSREPGIINNHFPFLIFHFLFVISERWIQFGSATMCLTFSHSHLALAWWLANEIRGKPFKRFTVA